MDKVYLYRSLFWILLILSILIVGGLLVETGPIFRAWTIKYDEYVYFPSLNPPIIRFLDKNPWAWFSGFCIGILLGIAANVAKKKANETEDAYLREQQADEEEYVDLEEV